MTRPRNAAALPVFAADDLFMVLENNLAAPGEPASWLFHDPVELVTCDTVDGVDPALARIQAGIDRGLHAAGWFSYELGYLLEAKLAPLLPPQEGRPPFILAGLFAERRGLTGHDLEAFWERQAAVLPTGFSIRHPQLTMTRAAYIDAILSIKDYILDGDTYQVNYTLKYLFEAGGNPFELYQALRVRQRTEFAAFINAPDRRVLSLSPELFFRKQGAQIACRPMKGTCPRGATPEEDDRQMAWLAADEKNRAENVMIVDLLRNDVGRLARPGTVRVPKLFHVERYETLHQMTSTVTAEVDAKVPVADLIYKLFPCGSITGAPKVRTMEIIRELETAARGIYTGSIGFIGPDNDSCFNVAIRTLDLRKDGAGEMGVGSGIIIDADPAAEYDECILKGRFMTGLAEQPIMMAAG